MGGMCGGMDGGTEGWMDARMDGRMGKCLEGQTAEQRVGQTDRWGDGGGERRAGTDRPCSGRTDGRTAIRRAPAALSGHCPPSPQRCGWEPLRPAPPRHWLPPPPPFPRRFMNEREGGEDGVRGPLTPRVPRGYECGRGLRSPTRGDRPPSMCAPPEPRCPFKSAPPRAPIGGRGHVTSAGHE